MIRMPAATIMTAAGTATADTMAEIAGITGREITGSATKIAFAAAVKANAAAIKESAPMIDIRTTSGAVPAIRIDP